jgi:hypothetical protein
VQDRGAAGPGARGGGQGVESGARRRVRMRDQGRPTWSRGSMRVRRGDSAGRNGARRAVPPGARRRALGEARGRAVRGERNSRHRRASRRRPGGICRHPGRALPQHRRRGSLDCCPVPRRRKEVWSFLSTRATPSDVRRHLARGDLQERERGGHVAQARPAHPGPREDELRLPRHPHGRRSEPAARALRGARGGWRAPFPRRRRDVGRHEPALIKLADQPHSRAAS